MPLDDALEELPTQQALRKFLDFGFMLDDTPLNQVLHVFLVIGLISANYPKWSVTIDLAHNFEIFLARTAQQVVSERFLDRQIENRFQYVVLQDLNMRVGIVLLEEQAEDAEGGCQISSQEEFTIEYKSYYLPCRRCLSLALNNVAIRAKMSDAMIWK
jgi:hypothetical protein